LLLEIEKKSFYGKLLRPMQQIVDEVSGKIITNKIDMPDSSLDIEEVNLDSNKGLLDILQG